MSSTPTPRLGLGAQCPIQPRYKDEATRSWWLDAGTREEFSAAVDREQSRILRSKAAALTLGGNIIVGYQKPR
jgi:hypothetical protein